MRADAIDFCENYLITATECEDMQLCKLAGRLVNFIIAGDTLTIVVNPEAVVRIKMELPEYLKTIETVSEVRESGGVVFLRVDLWEEKQKQVRFLVFRKEFVHRNFLPIVGEAGQETLQIGVGARRLEKRLVMSPKEAQRIFVLDDPNGNQYWFAFQMKPREFSLIGEGKVCVVKDVDYYGCQVDSVRPRRNYIPEEIHAFTGKIEFVDGNAIASEKIEEQYRRIVSSSSTGELLKLWKEYSSFERDSEYEEAQEYLNVCPHFTGRQKRGTQIRFYCSEASGLSRERFCQCELGFAVVSEADGKDKNNRLEAGKQIYLTDELVIDASNPDILLADYSGSDPIPERGYIVPSLKGAGYKDHRRNRALERVLQSKCPLKTLKLIVQSGEVQPIKHKTIQFPALEKKLFGENSEWHLNDRQREAIQAAVSTPDIALIQGPPGTGKTFIIKAILAYLEQQKYPYSVLVTSESHFAVDNATKETSYQGLPCKRMGGRFGKHAEQAKYTEWLENIKKRCNAYLDRTDGEEDYLGKVRGVAAALQACWKTVLSVNSTDGQIRAGLRELRGQIRESLPERGDLADMVEHAIEELGGGRADIAFRRMELRDILSRQKLDPEVYESEGQDAFFDLCDFADQYPELMPEQFQKQPEYWRFGDFESEADLRKAQEDVEQIKRHFASGEDGPRERLLTLLMQIEQELRANYKSIACTKAEAVRRFLEHVDDDSSNASFLSKYARYAAATCQQAANHRLGTLELKPVYEYDYVIIDEAAKANPLDMLIPMSMGSRIILVGDHKQLPHMVDNRIVNKVVKDRKRRAAAQETADGNDNLAAETEPERKTDAEMLRESLFAGIYHKLEGSGHAVMLDQQFRMNPKIGQLISECFYGGTLHSADGIEARTSHAISRYKGNPLVWIDMDRSNGEETPCKPSYKRECEAKRAAEEAEEILKATDSEFTIGMISFYAEQVDLIQELTEPVLKKYPKRTIKIGSVDAFQGQEFDAVILSAVRSNENEDFREAIGFLGSVQLQNVAFSRAKKLLIAIGDSATLCRFNADAGEERVNTKAFRIMQERSFSLK